MASLPEMRTAVPFQVTDLLASALEPLYGCLCCTRPARTPLCGVCERASGVPAGTVKLRRLPRGTCGPLGSVRFLARYATRHASPSPLAEALMSFKYGNHRHAGRRLCKLMASAVGELDEDFAATVAVPLHPRRLRRRGYNQSAWLARRCARALGCRYDRFALSRTRDTPPQALSPTEVRVSLAGTFKSPSSAHPYRHVLLIDDVYTSGATSTAAAQALLDAGVQHVDLYVLLMAATLV